MKSNLGRALCQILYSVSSYLSDPGRKGCIAYCFDIAIIGWKLDNGGKTIELETEDSMRFYFFIPYTTLHRHNPDHFPNIINEANFKRLIS